MDVEGHADKLIREATARGEFDDLPGHGEPLGALTMDPDWWVRAFLEREQLPERRQEIVEARKRFVREAIAADTLDEARILLARSNKLVRRWNDRAPADHHIEERNEVWLLDQRESARPTGRAPSSREA